MDIKYPKVNVPLEHPVIPSQNKYTVRPGDTLAQIARKFDMTADDLIMYNNLKNRHSLAPGMEIEIPPQSKAMTLEKAISISGGSAYAAASRVNQSWNNLIGNNLNKQINQIKEHIGFSNDISVTYSKRSYFPLKLLHTLSFNPLGKRMPMPFLSALEIFCNESRKMLKNAETESSAPSQLSQKTRQILENLVKYMAGHDFSKADIKRPNINKISEYYVKTGFKNITSQENMNSIINVIKDALSSAGVKDAVISEPNKHGLNQMDIFLAGFAAVMGW